MTKAPHTAFFGGADIGVQSRAPKIVFCVQERPEGFFAYPKATKGFSEKIIKQILISLGPQGWVALFFGMGSCGSPNLLWVTGVVALTFFGARGVLGYP